LFLAIVGNGVLIFAVWLIAVGAVFAHSSRST
jgi:hypothetical protein